MSKFLRLHGPQHTRPPCPLLSPGVCSHSLGDSRIPSLTQWTWVWANLSYGSGGKESACNAGDSRDIGLIPGLGRSLEKEMTTHSRSPMDRGAWWATVHGAAKSWTWLSVHTHTFTHIHIYGKVTSLGFWFSDSHSGNQVESPHCTWFFFHPSMGIHNPTPGA